MPRYACPREERALGRGRHADQLLLHPARRQAEGLGQGVPDAARGDQGRRDRRRRRPVVDASTTWRAPRWSRTRPSSTSSTAPSPPTSRASSCSPTSRQEIPLEWLQKTLELELSPEEKAAIEKMGWDELMETLKKRFEEQKERHEGGSKMIGTGGTSPVRRLRLQPAGHPHRPGQGPQQERGQGLGPAPFKDYDDTLELGTRNIKVALRRLRRFAREGSERGARPRRHDPRAPPPTPAGSTSRWCPSGTTR